MNITPNNLPTSPSNPTSLTAIVENAGKIDYTQYILPGILVLVFLVLLYYAYCEFICNSEKPGKNNSCDDDNDNERDGFVEGNRQERTDTVADFNLEEAIRSLEQMQSKILRELSDDAGL